MVVLLPAGTWVELFNVAGTLGGHQLANGSIEHKIEDCSIKNLKCFAMGYTLKSQRELLNTNYNGLHL